MADRLWRVQATLPLGTNIAADSVVNTWHFDDDDDPVAAPSDTAGWITSALTAFYQAIDDYLAYTLLGVVNLKMYDLTDPEPRTPVATSQFNITPGGGTPLPNEVALCMSYRAGLESGVPAARRRGRIYLGPFGTDAASELQGHSKPSVALRTAVANAGAALIDGVAHPGSPGLHLKWAHYSPRTDELGASLADSFNDVQAGWVDDAWDIQRRRGHAPTTRTTFS